MSAHSAVGSRDSPMGEPLDFLLAQRADLERLGPPGYGQRMMALEALGELLDRHCAELGAAIARDFGGRSQRETEIFEIYPLQAEIRHVRRHLRSWMRPRRAATAWPFFPARAETVVQPVGVVGIMGAWNYPLLLTLLPLISVLAAGNHAMIKAPRLAGASSTLLARLLGKRFPVEYVMVLQGGAQLNQIFPSLPFDHLIFSGSTRTGRVIARAAARNLMPVTLSLSGKSPAIVHQAYPVAMAARRILGGKLMNAGQTCIAPDYVFVAEQQLGIFLSAAQETIQELYPRWWDNPDYTAIPDGGLYARLQDLLQDARQKGAQSWAPAGTVVDHGQPGWRFPPTLLWDLRDDMAVMEEEIFGPLLAIRTYTRIDEAFAYVHAHPAPLALYYFDPDRRRARRCARGLQVGGVTINDTIFHAAQPGLPFGGIGASGMGQYRGEYGFHRFSHHLGVFYQSRYNACDWIRPPYGAISRRLMQALIRSRSRIFGAGKT